jgi:hypothetical protein
VNVQNVLGAIFPVMFSLNQNLLCEESCRITIPLYFAHPNKPMTEFFETKTLTDKENHQMIEKRLANQRAARFPAQLGFTVKIDFIAG